MKKVIFILALCFATSLTFAQQIDTLSKGIVAVRINGVKASFQDTANSVFLGAYVVSDNLKNSATFYWQLMLPVKDSSGAVIGVGAVTNSGNYTMTPAQYALWCHPEDCNTYPFTVIAQAYGLTFPPPTGSSTSRR
jgi:hypothetical protein